MLAGCRAASRETGTYILNFKACAKCGGRKPLLEMKLCDNPEDDLGDGSGDDEEEAVEYDHVCSDCHHTVRSPCSILALFQSTGHGSISQVARHYYRFSTPTDLTQTFFMECILCGRGADHVDNREFARPNAVAPPVMLSVGGTEQSTDDADKPDVTAAYLASLSQTIRQRLELHRPQRESASGDEWED
jgi:hypothetical protein